MDVLQANFALVGELLHFCTSSLPLTSFLLASPPCQSSSDPPYFCLFPYSPPPPPPPPPPPGDDGEGDEPNEGELVKVSDDSFTLWCAGRQNCSAMLVHLQVWQEEVVVRLGMGLLL